MSSCKLTQEEMDVAFKTPIPPDEWKDGNEGELRLCHHLQSAECDASCTCGYRGVVWGPKVKTGDRLAFCQPGHEVAPGEQAGSEPPSYSRELQLQHMQRVVALWNAMLSIQNPSDFVRAARELGKATEQFVYDVEAFGGPVCGMCGGNKSHESDCAYEASRKALSAFRAAGGGG